VTEKYDKSMLNVRSFLYNTDIYFSLSIFRATTMTLSLLLTRMPTIANVRQCSQFLITAVKTQPSVHRRRQVSLTKLASPCRPVVANDLSTVFIEAQ